MTAQLLIEDFSLVFRTRHGVVRALEDVSLSVQRGEIVGVVGESGSGKSVLAYAVMGLQDAAAQVQGGRIVFGGLDMLTASARALADVRGRELAMVFQSPRTALNPIRKVGRQIEDILREHANLPARALRGQAVAALARVRIPDPERRYDAYPFELSGGMCQRVMIAMALACHPVLLLADEPTTALDVTVQAQILRLIRKLQDELGMGVLFITHNLGVVAEIADQVAVMYGGQIVESAAVAQLFDRPSHPYTRALLRSLPDAEAPHQKHRRLTALAGQMVDPRRPPPGCRFAPRCDRVIDACLAMKPAEQAMEQFHRVRCIRVGEA
jgi:peptide/nickel transport system ATP-binding protein